jgi:phosphotransferase system IIB component
MANNMETINNKYKQWHDNIIARGKNRKLSGYKEKHHILPRSLGGNNSKDNLVDLTPKEHFIIHMLLCKFTKGEAKRSMFFALNSMMNLNNRGMRKIKYSSRTFEKVRKQCAKYLKGNKYNLGRIPSKQTRLKISQSTKGLKKSNETRLRMSLANKGKVLSQEVKQKIANSLKGEKSFWFGKKHTQETKNKMSKKAKGRQNALGMKHTEDAKKRMSESKLGNKHTLGMICVNKDNKTKMIYKNELKNYLNLGFIKGKIKRTQQELRNN